MHKDAEAELAHIGMTAHCPLGVRATGLCVGTPALHGRADPGQQPQINPAHSDTASAARGPSSSAPIVQLAGTASRPPCGVASRWLRQPRPGTHSRGFRACEEDGERAAVVASVHTSWQAGPAGVLAVVSGMVMAFVTFARRAERED